MTRRVNLPVLSGLEVVLVCLVKIPAVVLSVLFCLPVQTCSCFYTRLTDRKWDGLHCCSHYVMMKCCTNYVIATHTSEFTKVDMEFSYCLGLRDVACIVHNVMHLL